MEPAEKRAKEDTAKDLSYQGEGGEFRLKKMCLLSSNPAPLRNSPPKNF